MWAAGVAHLLHLLPGLAPHAGLLRGGRLPGGVAPQVPHLGLGEEGGRVQGAVRGEVPHACHPTSAPHLRPPPTDQVGLERGLHRRVQLALHLLGLLVPLRLALAPLREMGADGASEGINSV